MVQEADVRAIRKKLAMSQEKLADKLGVTRNTVSRWELGEVSPSAENLTALNRLLAQFEDPPHRERNRPRRRIPRPQPRPNAGRLFSCAPGSSVPC